MDVSPIGRAALMAREGCRLKAYRDSVGVWTIGVGLTTASGLITVTPGLTITQAQADALFAQSIEKYAAPVRAALSRPCTQEQFDAMVSLCFNIGPVGFAHSTVVRQFNAVRPDLAAAAFLMWNKPAVLAPRRRAERDQFLSSYVIRLPKARDTDAKPVADPSVPSGFWARLTGALS